MNIGIELGTCTSWASRLDLDGRAVLVPDQISPTVHDTPSVLHVSAGAALVGHSVEYVLEEDPSFEPIRSFKTHFAEVEPIFYDDQGNAWFAESAAALVLKKLRLDAEALGAASIEGAVVAVPAYFNEPQRRALLSAATMAELPVVSLVEEPVATALHYGVLSPTNDQAVAVLDWGGNRIDVTILGLERDAISVMAKGSSASAGGKVIDEIISSMILDGFSSVFGAPPPLTPRVVLDLSRISEEIKIEMTSANTRVRRLVLLGGQAVEVVFTKSLFDSAIRDLIDQTEAVLLRCVRDSGLRVGEVGALLMAGGSSLIPAVERRIRGTFSGTGQRVMNCQPRAAVALGAALRSSQLRGDPERSRVAPEIRGLSSHAIGVRTVTRHDGRSRVDTIMKPNIPLPASASRTYYTERPDQQRMVLEFVELGNADSEPVSLGRLVVGPLLAPRENYPIDVTVENSEDGIVKVRAYDAETGVELSHTFERFNDECAAHFDRQCELVRSTTVNGG